MRVIMLMFDTLSKNYLPCYGNKVVQAPNFERLQKKAVTFDSFYAGSMPCIPARREIHTGRYNFLHRSWGPLEPFDYSIMETLKGHGVYTHICSDHSHYWEDGGATYLPRYNTWEGFRGQEGDRWKPHDLEIDLSKRHHLSKEGISINQHYSNRKAMVKEAEFSTVQAMKAGIDFLETHVDKDNWFLQIESFDPHEPFYVPQIYKDLYQYNDTNVEFDWPKYQKVDVIEYKEEIEDLKTNYAALISMCDFYLGKVLDFMDEHDMWRDTAFILNTDHGFLLGEHEYLGKNTIPFYNNIINTPFFMYHPDVKEINTRRNALCQTIDIAPTILDCFGIKDDYEFDGQSILPYLFKDGKGHDEILFGVHGGHINIFDGDYIYMRSNIHDNNQPYVEFTLMPTMMRGFFSSEDIDKAEFVNGERYSQYHKCLKIPVKTYMNMKKFGNLLFDIKKDPNQLHPLDNNHIEAIMIEKMIKKMKEVEAPMEEYQRVGLDY